MVQRVADGGYFSIDTEDDPIGPETWGRISLGDFAERFEVPLSYWTGADYENHWREAVGRIVDGFSRSALITAIADPTKVSFFVWWPMYLVGDTVHVQNHLLFLADLGMEFDLSNPYRHVRDRQVGSEEGPISEWAVPVSSLRDWLTRTRG